jgi:hypothetical protein
MVVWHAAVAAAGASVTPSARIRSTVERASASSRGAATVHSPGGQRMPEHIREQPIRQVDGEHLARGRAAPSTHAEHRRGPYLDLNNRYSLA